VTIKFDVTIVGHVECVFRRRGIEYQPDVLGLFWYVEEPLKSIADFKLNTKVFEWSKPV
jgi:hypothetical protein